MTMQFRSPHDVMRESLKAELLLLLEACTPAQRAKHDEIVESGRAAKRWPNGLDSMSVSDLETQLHLVHRTLRTNVAKPSPST
jgi:hypothetical protein